MRSAVRHMWRYAIRSLSAALWVCVATFAIPGTASGDIACLKVLSETGDVVLGVDRQYLWSLDKKLEGPVGGFVVYVNWRDLSPRIGNRLRPFDYGEVTAPDWSIDRTTAGASVRISSKRLPAWPLRRRTSPNYIEVESDLPGWRKVETCASCNQVQYFPIPDHDSIDELVCVIRPYGPEATCSFYIRAGGFLVGTSIPKPAIRHYELFLNRVKSLIGKFKEEGRARCGG